MTVRFENFRLFFPDSWFSLDFPCDLHFAVHFFSKTSLATLMADTAFGQPQ